MSAAEQLNPSDLVPSVGIDFMCEQRAGAIAKIEQAARIIGEAVDMLRAGPNTPRAWRALRPDDGPRASWLR